MHPSIRHEFVKKYLDKRKKNNSVAMHENNSMSEINNVLFVKLQPPTKPKPPPFFEQAYWGRSKIASVISDRASSVGKFKPYSDKPQDDALSYFEYKDNQERESIASKPRSKSKCGSYSIKEKLNKGKRNSKFNATFYKPDNEGLVTSSNYKLSRRNLKKLSGTTSNLSIMDHWRQNSSSTKNQRLERLRQKYLNQAGLSNLPVAKDNDKKPVIKVEDIIEPKQNLQTVESENNEGEKDEEEIPPICAQTIDVNDKKLIKEEQDLPKERKLDIILQELKEEKKKRQELEIMVQELLSRTGMSNSNYQKDIKVTSKN